MAFDCDTQAANIDPVAHYRDCVAVCQLSFQVFSLNPAIELTPGQNPTFDMYQWLVGVVGTNCTAAFNEINAAGEAGGYQPEYLANLSEACAQQLQPASQWLVGRMSNDPDTRNCFSAICEVVIAFADPFNEGYAPIVNPFG